MNKKIKIMLAQLNPTVGDLEKNSKIVMETYEEASKQKADVLAFPEMFLSGYQLQDLVLKKAFQEAVKEFIKFLAKKCVTSTYLLLGAPILEKEKLEMERKNISKVKNFNPLIVTQLQIFYYYFSINNFWN